MTRLLALILLALLVSGCATPAPGRPPGPSFQDKTGTGEGGGNGGMGGGMM